MKKNYPLLFETARYLEDKCFFFKGVMKQLEGMNLDYSFGEELCQKALESCKNDKAEYFKKVDNTIEASLEFLKFQIELEKTGKYRYSTFGEVSEQEYKKNKGLSGPGYLWGLYFSQFFWLTHNQVFNFFQEEFVSQIQLDKGMVLEAPAGSGIYIIKFLQHSLSWRGTGVDISDAAIKLSGEMSFRYGVSDRLEIKKRDFFEFETKEKYDAVICGELLEHVEDPLKLLAKIKNILSPNGKAFITGAVWAGMSDHIYLYQSAEEVRNHIRKAGFSIEKEKVAVAFKKASAEQKRTPILYAAIVTHKKTND